MEITNEIRERLEQLNDKYEAIGQDLLSYLDGLLYADVTTYWDYVQLDTLLSLQKPKTKFPDEVVFIIYHQITELYFKLALQEFKELGQCSNVTKVYFIDRVGRINRYFEALIKSFSVMVDGMDREEFLKFRMSLLPASGFQSAQYREVEIYSTDFINLVDKAHKSQFSTSSPIEEMYTFLYWKAGATDAETGKKTLTLTQFEDKYSEAFISLGLKCRDQNLWRIYLSLSDEDQQDPKTIEVLKTNDMNVNIYWPLAHYKSAVRYLAKKNDDIAATGGTNWQQYLPPKFQKRIFYPSLWTEAEKEAWGKGWVEEQIKEILRGA
jgi:tryptophan 2,3-dioxygenase